MACAACLSDYFEAVARKQKLEPPAGFGYKADVSLGVGCFLDDRTTCKVLEKPFCIPSGKRELQGYIMMYGYCQQEGMVSILEGQMPPMLPCTSKDPKQFSSLVEIAENFGNKDPQAAAKNSEYCVAFRVPSQLATKADTPGRDLYMVRFDQDVVSPFLQAVKEGAVEKVKAALAVLPGDRPGDVVDEHGVSGLMMAAFGGWEETCQALLVKGAEVNDQEPYGGRTPLMFAAQGGHSKVVSILMAAKADPAKVDTEGNSALMWAAIAGKADVVRQLAPVSNKDARGKEGMTALDLAKKMNHADVVAALS